MQSEPLDAVYIMLLRDLAAATAAAEAIITSSSAAPLVLHPPCRGLDFFADPGCQRDLDEWWASVVPQRSFPIYLLKDEPGLELWLRGIDGHIYIATSYVDDARYRELSHVRLIAARDPGEFGRQVRADAAVQTFSPLPVTAPFSPRFWAQPDEARAPAAARTHPLEALAAMVNPQSASAPAPSAAMRADPNAVMPQERHLSSSLLHRIPSIARSGIRLRRQEDPADSELAATITRSSSVLVAVGSRKGGVGKTSHAAGVAISAGEALDTIGHRAAIVDSNLANPDAWGHLSLPSGAATVRDAVVALMAGNEPPRPAYASTPALACYPESRSGSEYSRVEIQRFGSYLRSQYAFSVVDMSNRLPDPTGGPEAAAAAYWLEQADVLLLPTASSKQEFNGVLDYLDLGGLPPTVVAYIVPRSRRNREHPLTKKYLEAITQRVTAVVRVPDDAERVRYAVMEGLPVQAISSTLRSSYRRLTAALAMAAATS